MRDGFIKVAAITPKIKVADPIYNAGQIIDSINFANKENCKIMVFPENCISGYTCGELFLQDALLDASRKALMKIANATKDIDELIFVGLPLEERGKLFNVAAIIKNAKILGFVPKLNLPNYAQFYEARHFAVGNTICCKTKFDGYDVPFGSNLIIDLGESIKGLMIGTEICEDAWVANAPDIRLAENGATIIVNLSASDENVGKDIYRRSLISSISARTHTGYVYASAGDGESTTDVVFSGHNIIAEDGRILNEANLFENGILISEIDVARLCHERRMQTTFNVQNSDEYTYVPAKLNIEETNLTRSFYNKPFVPANKEMRDKSCRQILDIQCHGLKKRLEHTNCKTAVIGVSGGLDSTLALIVISRTFDMLSLDKKGIIAVTMPGFGTTDRTYDNACILAKTLGATLKEVSIKDAVLQHFKDIGQDENKKDVTYENSQARERTQILMDIANKENGLVIGTGDMSELALGWATYNGDHMSMYGVNAGVPKTLVRYLVSFYADSCNIDELSRVLRDVLDTPVSPELLPPENGIISQKTEDLVGPYELHDFFLYYMVRCGFGPRKIYRIACLAFELLYDKETIKKWLTTFVRRFFAQQFKRSALPDGPKVGTVALSPRGDLRMPSDASANAFLKELENL